MFHARITHSENKIFAHVDAVMMREQFIDVTASLDLDLALDSNIEKYPKS